MTDTKPVDELPPVIPNIQETLEGFLSNPERLRIHQFQNNLRTFPVFPSKRDVQPLLNFHDAPIPLIQQVKRDPTTGKIISYEEVETKCFGESAKNSFSLNRALGPRNEFLRGNSTNYPFWPGGIAQNELYGATVDKLSDLSINGDSGNDVEDEAALFEKLFEKDILVAPPGFDEGIDFNSLNERDTVENVKFEENVGALNFWGCQNKAGVEIELDKKLSEAKFAQSENKFKRLLRGLVDDKVAVPNNQDDAESVPVLRISKTPLHSSTSTMKLPWAEMVDVTKPMTDFHERVPDMAYKYEFELDTFQKEAIVRLEEHENVFVAAHTSAGKTVVAEYAIALSSRHMTRTVYTSPIKALSNQKFRDFKLLNCFESVGLVTGDVQINPSASCLIMTTEILRSMLYNGSDVIRDLEWVIFDEIHYLNNEERGHVWEEVLIMLPQHVSIIMLSATVPNALQFANWVGEIKRKKIYVISTHKRPIPLEHFLYTGTGGKSRNEQFLILDSEERFIKKGYDDAKEAKNARMSKFQKSYGPNAKDQQRQQGFNEQQERNSYVGLINHLKESDKLPVIVFTFSRNRCDQYAQLMASCIDLSSGEDKGKIHGFFQQSISKLKGSDRELPQVLQVQEMLKNGFGVHHSGILPILKEVVEMLFQKGFVKVLFATETFAMGVNMPARTVVFDQCRKHDGTCFRSLNPAEYIQMAGRAGRRGKDPIGTVIILCKAGIPELQDLQTMLTGKAAKLESQFRLTYSMILNLLRVESLTVEDVMKRSFLENGKSNNVEHFKDNRKKVMDKLEEIENVPRNEDLEEFCHTIKSYIFIRDSIMEFLVVIPALATILNPGRCVLFDYPNHSPRFGIILKQYATKEGNRIRKNYDVLTLYDAEEEKNPNYIPFSPDYSQNKVTNEQVNRNFQQYVYHASGFRTKFMPVMVKADTEKYPSHKIIQIYSNQILEICSKNPIRADEVAVRNDIKTREMERFRNKKPVPNVLTLLQEVYTITTQELTEPNSVLFIDIFDINLSFKDSSLLLRFDQLHASKTSVASMKRPKLNNLEELQHVFEYLRLIDARNDYDYLLSPQSLQLHEEYESRINVLKKLGYINNECLVQLKGRVACEMGNQNELLVTEMVLNNILSDCPPEEIAALLSCMVFEAKAEEPTLPPDFHLAQKVQEIKNTARKIGETQRECGLKEPVEQYVEQFKFGLVEVVYEWAKGEEFVNIMRLTDVQEGIIVRTIQRLDEMIRDVKDAARIIGDPSLKKKMEQASECIKRDIVFAASLYTQ